MTTTQTKECPILFSGPMVQAILDGRKTMTRRIVKPQPTGWTPEQEMDGITWAWCVNGDQDYSERIRCPYGQPGDRLWVRETWLPDPPDDHTWDDHTCTYVEWSGCGAKTQDIPLALQDRKYCLYRATWDGHDLTWRPSIFMPRWASRITLEITGVRVERLQEITPQDIVKEGLFYEPGAWADASEYRHMRSAFEHLWNKINGAESWTANPWVWVVSFKRI